MCAKQDRVLFAKLNQETALINWEQLQRFFAQGKVFVVNSNDDLVLAAEQIASNNAKQVTNLINESKIKKVSDDQAKSWIKVNQPLWAVVVAPWVLVQLPKDQDID